MFTFWNQFDYIFYQRARQTIEMHIDHGIMLCMRQSRRQVTEHRVWYKTYFERHFADWSNNKVLMERIYFRPKMADLFSPEGGGYILALKRWICSRSKAAVMYSPEGGGYVLAVRRWIYSRLKAVDLISPKGGRLGVDGRCWLVLAQDSRNSHQKAR